MQSNTRTRQILVVWAAALVVVGCGQQIDTDDMVDMTVKELEEEYGLDNTLFWDTPNLPYGSQSEKIYYLDCGDLVVNFDDEGRISIARFEQRENPPKQRYDAVQQGWSEFVKERNPPISLDN